MASMSSSKDDIHTIGPDAEYEEFKILDAKYQGKALSKLILKVDIRLVPIFALLFLLNFLDRSNVGNARVAGMTETIPMTDSQYNTALTLFYVFYVVLEVPSQMILKRSKPKFYLSGLVVGWGLVCALTSQIQNVAGFQITRAFLGTTEAGLFAGTNYIFSEWYSRRELGARVSTFFCAASVAGGFSGILAYGISFMSGLGGMEGWRWIFLIEGLVTIVIGLMCPFVIQDDIANCTKWLSEEESRFLLLRRRYSESGPVATSEEFHWKYVKMAFLDWQTYLQVFVYLAHSTLGYSISFTLPVIIRTLQFSTIESFLIPVPIYFVAGILAFINSRWSDKRGSRFPHIISPLCMALVGVIMCFSTAGKPHLVAANLVGLILMTFAAYMAISPSIAWAAGNVVGYKKAVSFGMLIGFGNLSGIIASNIYLTSEAPKYPTGYGVSLGLICFGMLNAIILRFTYARINRKRDQLSKEDIERDWSDEKLADASDRSPYFRYSL